jgi:hypothetical protein
VKLVFIYGPVASGKLTVARALAALTGLAVFHNHLIVDAVASIFPFGTERFVRLREQFWLTMLGEAAEAGRSAIFTFAPEPSVAPGFAERAREVVAAGGGEVAFVRLAVSAAEQETRIVAESRAAFGKLRSVALLRELRDQFAACEAAMPAPTITIDTATSAPAEAAMSIAQALRLPPITGIG